MAAVCPMLELRLACKSPTLDAEFALDEKTPLILYDCLIPQLKENRRFRITKDSEFSIADFYTQQKIVELQREIEQK